MSSATSPAPDIELKKKKKKSKKKTQELPKSQSILDNEEDAMDTDPRGANWAYVPPSGATLLEHDVDNSVFDWDEINNSEDLDVWIIRVPDAVRAKHLEGLELHQPSSSRSALVGSVSKKHIGYDVWSIRKNDSEISDIRSRAVPVGGEEVLGLSCLLPRRKHGGKLYSCPKPIAHHLVVSARNPLPTPDPSSPELPTQDPATRRYRHPQHLLKHHFVPYGGNGVTHAGKTSMMDTDDVVEVTREEVAAPLHSGKSDGPTKEDASKANKPKKRKGDADSPKRTKKVKM
ncbi:hypothetical protein BD410DRAFT_751371 [Rickenella mellea]|uniref:Uncharacterized protein n=1 Tax=Rickenella mellea TaxID=50990 RepID=A0A4Y7PYV8_9AGAM|nr:hypothetical protein BD410DRAFT_751371 [Rickenella mellea]